MLVVRVTVGERVRVGDRVLTLLRVQRPGVAVVQLDNGERFGVIWDRKVEVLPRVFLTADRKKSYYDTINLLFKAPVSINIGVLRHEPEPSERHEDG